MTEQTPEAQQPENSLIDLQTILLATGVPSRQVRNDWVVFPSRETYITLVSRLQEVGFDMCSDLSGVDYLQHTERWLPEGVEPERFEVVVVLTSLSRRERLRIRLQVPETEPTAPTVFHLYPGSEAMEREAFDMFGLRFEGHPDMTRILMPEDWEGHPLRKDYSPGRVPVQFKEAPGPR